MDVKLITGLLTFIALTSNTYAQSVICPKPERIEHKSSEEGWHSYTAKAPNGAIWQETEEQETPRNLKAYEFAGALIDDQKVACRYKSKVDAAVILELQLNPVQSATPANNNNWRSNECQSSKPTSCAIEFP